MKITPLDIRRKEFKRSVRGYSDEEVDIFLDEVADEFERIFQENVELQERANRLDEQIAGHVQLKDALEKTLISAQLQAEELRANAHKESELILRDADIKAKGIVSASYGETQKTQQALVQLKLLEEDFRFKFRSLLEGYLRLLNEAPLAVATADTTTLDGTVIGPEATAEQAVAAEPAPVAAKPAPTAAKPAPTTAGPTPTTVRPTSSLGEPPAIKPEPGNQDNTPARTAPATSVHEDDSPGAPGPEGYMPVPPPGSGPPPSADATAPSAADRPALFEERWPTVEPDEDVPTEENLLAMPNYDESAPGGAASVAEQRPGEDGTQDDMVAESGASRESSSSDQSEEVESPRGFFFGRRVDDLDDTFSGEDGIRKDKTRDFEW